MKLNGHREEAFSYEECLELMDEAGVSRVLIVPPSWKGDRVDYALEACEKHPEIDGVVTPLQPYDSTYIPANRTRAFRNTGQEPMKILWIYAGVQVTRTFADSGKTVEHLSAQDLMGIEQPK